MAIVPYAQYIGVELFLTNSMVRWVVFLNDKITHFLVVDEKKGSETFRG